MGSVMLGRLSAERRSENNFDLLRLFAALLVLFAHSFDLTDGLEPLIHASWGDVGVIIFFSISGFLVCRSWDYNPRLGAFAAKRALRLLPGLIVALCVTALILGPLVSTETAGAYFGDPTTKSYILNNALLQTDFGLPGVFAHNVYPGAVNGSLWTLPVEAKAYVIVALFGVIGVLTRIRGLMVLVAFYAVIAMFPGGRAWLPGGAHYVAFLTNIQMPAATVSGVKAAATTGDYTIYTIYLAAFAMGSALYVLRRFIPVLWPLALVAFAAIVYAIATQVGFTVLYVLVFAAPYLILCLAYRTHSFVRLPSSWGDYSYGIYVYAFPVQQTVSQLLAPISGWAMFPIALVPTCAAAVLSWHFVESPMLRVKRIIGGSTADASEPIASA
jgi:peptidoglycan/LPS O-acetylase OafA/YrhL